jgi:hypothetical protein
MLGSPLANFWARKHLRSGSARLAVKSSPLLRNSSSGPATSSSWNSSEFLQYSTQLFHQGAEPRGPKTVLAAILIKINAYVI